MSDKIKQLVEHLQGTSKSLSEACDDFGFDSDELTQQELEEIDAEIFCCETCGWWSEVSEMADQEGEQVCLECVDN
jgi:hypothetical protein